MDPTQIADKVHEITGNLPDTPTGIGDVVVRELVAEMDVICALADPLGGFYPREPDEKRDEALRLLHEATKQWLVRAQPWIDTHHKTPWGRVRDPDLIGKFMQAVCAARRVEQGSLEKVREQQAKTFLNLANSVPFDAVKGDLRKLLAAKRLALQERQEEGVDG